MKDKETLAAIEYFYSLAGVVKPDGPDMASALAIKAAVERNPTYKDDADIKKIHKTWSEELKKIFFKYQKEEQSKEVFVADVMELQRKMNEAFPIDFKNNGRNLGKGKGKDTNYDKVFRVAHAQKSLSVFLKHMWCISPAMPMPPVCPIDKRILKEAKIYEPWTKLNCIEKYEEWLDRLEVVAGTEHLAKWELVKWNQPSEQVSSLKHKEKQASNKSDKPIDNQIPPIYQIKGRHDVLEEEKLIFNGSLILLIVGRTPGGYHFCGFWNKNGVIDSISELPKIINNPLFSSLKWETEATLSRKYVMFRSKNSYIKAKELKDKISEFIHNTNK